MQIMYIMALLVAVGVMIMSGGRQPEPETRLDAAATARHMTTWHRAATEVCLDAGTGCAGGVVQAAPRLSPMIASGSAYAGAPFTSRYDSVSGRLVTYMTGTTVRQGTGFGAVSAALQDMMGVTEQSSHAGVWNASTGRIVYSMPPPVPAPRALTLPSPFAGGTIPDGSPVIVSIPRR